MLPAQRVTTMKFHLEHVNLTVKNIDESVRFLTTAFRPFKVRGEGVADGNRWLHVGTDRTYIALDESPHDRSAPGPLNHLGYVVDDVDAVAARLREAGFKEGMTAPPHPHRRRIFLTPTTSNTNSSNTSPTSRPSATTTRSDRPLEGWMTRTRRSTYVACQLKFLATPLLA
jgi:catechol 2,3-dioxygenase-like lactoylglutathione lyase family enzyme